MPSLPQDSPAAGLGTGFPMARGPPSELMGFYITSYEAAFGKRSTGSPQKFQGRRVLRIEPPSDRSRHPLLGVYTGSGYVTNNYTAAAFVVFPYVERQDTNESTTSRDFKIFRHPDYRRLLPTYVRELECRYPADFPFSHLRFGEVTAPKAYRGNDTWSPHTSPAQPDVPQRTMELSGFTRTDPRSDLTLPEQPVNAVPTMSPVPPPLSTPGDTFPLPQPDVCDGSDGFLACHIQHSPACHGPPCPLRLPRVPSGTQGSHYREGAADVQHCPEQVPEFTPLVPVAPGWWAQTPITCAPRSVEGIQIPSPSGFSTNNHPTNLWHIDKTLM